MRSGLCFVGLVPALLTAPSVALAQSELPTDAEVRKRIGAAVFASLPVEDQRRAVQATFEPAWTTTEQRVLDRIRERNAEGLVTPMLCFQPGTNPAFVEAVHEALFDDRANRFLSTGRWSTTALSPAGTGAIGEPVILTYGYVPDGTRVPDLFNLISPTSNGLSNLFAWLNGIYGSEAVWQPIFDESFDAWGALSGNTYVYEPNDDGAILNSAVGVAGVRADLRIAAVALDGNSGVLAYNNFPADGDMVFDSADAFYNDTSFDNLSLRNVIMHEHGHGLGMLHVCPIQQSTLMEPFISRAFLGPQLDDQYSVLARYGDIYEPNRIGLPASLGPLSLAPGESIAIEAAISSNADNDTYEIDLSGLGAVRITATPFGESIRFGPQTGACDLTGGGIGITDFENALRLGISASGNTVSAANLGDSISLETVAPQGTFTFSVVGTGLGQVQPYTLTIEASPLSSATLDTQIPSVISPFRATGFTADLLNATPQSAQLFYRGPGEQSFSSLALNIGAGDQLSGFIPAYPCGDEVQIAIEATSTQGQVTRFPQFGTFTVTSGTPNSELSDNGETDEGWVVGGTATDGQWVRGFPTDDLRGDPRVDADGSGRAWLTDVDMFNVNSDVDGGITTLTSRTLDTTGDATLSYSLWYTNAFGSNENLEFMNVQLSGDGGASWVIIDQEGPLLPSVGWTPRTLRVSDHITPSDNTLLRFAARDLIGAIIEAGVDSIEVTRYDCPDVCTPDVTTTNTNPGDAGYGSPDGAVDGADISFYVELWLANDAAADFTTTNTNPGDAGFGTPDSVIDGADLSFFVELWLAGCP